MKKNSSPVQKRQGASSFASCRRGGIAVLGVFLFGLMVLAVGIGVDLTRLMLVRSRLQTAVDAAALVAGREMNLPVNEAEADAKALFWSNFGRTGTSTDPNNKSYLGYLGAVAGDPTFTRPSGDVNTVTVNATAIVDMTLMGIVGANAKLVPAQASAKRAVYGMELALVLDITGSMGRTFLGDKVTRDPNTNITGLYNAATNLVNIVFGPKEYDSNTDPLPKLFVSVVPFTASVNIGTGHANWVTGLDTSKYSPTIWAGCVEARGGSDDQTDTDPLSKPFTPYLYPNTTGVYVDGKKPIKGDNDWSANNITETQQATIDDNTAVGPNLGCSAIAIQPLTPSKKKVQASIDALVSTYRGGTAGNLGLQAGWFTLSPKWTTLWGTPNSPLPYGTPFMQKVVVFMTDGNNNWYDWPGGAPGAAASAYDGRIIPPSTKSTPYDSNTVDADYTGYGRLSDKRLGGGASSSVNAAKLELDKRSTALCTNMKKAGITIYTVILGSVDSATQTLWQNCASKKENYFNSPNKEDLAKAFQQIGTQLASLRLTL